MGQVLYRTPLRENATVAVNTATQKILNKAAARIASINSGRRPRELNRSPRLLN